MLPPFLRGPVPGLPPVVSAWLRGLEEVEETVRRWTADLEEEGFWWRPAPGLNPIGGILRHIARASRRLLAYGLDRPLPADLEGLPVGAEEFEPLGQRSAEVRAEFEQAWAELRAAYQGLAEADLARLVHVGRRRIAVQAVFVLHHLVEHAQHHAGQLIVLRKLWEARSGAQQQS
ncbi:MAG: DinB family protein [Bacteroidetes bacterium]|nr:DinB family protein [Rhodothermia bacterium]MCS7155455.1 DinB family protein [Bacteroidota bacterium]MCX7907452.1 DinB family protein [Bacteroidota bacterium]MDW8138446.1 DinB family protein [Bacteroidota bacterium]MDW8284617.1 DinB family protein [Bacteroidota bacterium]